MKSVYLLLLVLLSGCTSIDDREYKSESGKVWTVNKLKEDYKNKTGMTLIPPNTSLCGWDGTCYYNKWAKVYDKDLGAYMDKIANEKAIKEQAEEESKCLANPECKRSEDLLKARQGLSWAYSMLLGIYPYDQANTDYLVRDVCEKVTTAQKKGVSKDVLADRMRDAPGIAPRARGFLTEVAKSCWEISNLSGDWREAIRQ